MIATPIMGKLSQVGTERIIGTVAGGVLGYFTYTAGELLWRGTVSQRDDGIILSLAAFGFTFLSVSPGRSRA